MDHFNEYHDILDQIKDKRLKIEVLREDMKSVRGIRYDDTPKGSGTPMDLTHYLIEIEELEEEIKELKKKETEIRKIHEEEIGKVEKPKYRRLLRMHYLMRIDMRTIAEALDVTPNHAWKMKKRAEIEFQKTNDRKG